MTQPPTDGYRVDRDGADSGALILKRQDVELGRLDYRLAAGVIYIDFVEVTPASRGLGLGVRLVDAAANWARESSRTLVPICGYARHVLMADAKYQDVLASAR